MAYPKDGRALRRRETDAVACRIMASPGTARMVKVIARRMTARTGKYHSAGYALRLLIKAWIRTDMIWLKRHGLDATEAYRQVVREKDQDQLRLMGLGRKRDAARVFEGGRPPEIP